ncbi:LamB/YcsF family protein [Microbulbifer thermotolerans]|uniref:LamB/YcsF family protein n=1 Tax=Microbulbifer thermotolerans TaxID=252514 RepID=UPI002248E216|nr:LamB/YcsF family protein [Microbulbifer thermotolerans]MCX2780220.1 LamB/YcsF family protein [Microbulbifer thermotolerans]MCX2795955.1 LamB/YcsF family protein [Microbulbifer thermotolerans]MCX2805826.1 LamB/YcsF family protein [Microbulbifer thermotolerans]MCX2842675.1 LamB/YcsF family protein [Microbulbifer thermotolerans]
MERIDINSDLGEGTSSADCDRDARIMPYISRCNIACGAHAGNLLTMRQSLDNARKHGVTAGAHPGYPDPARFGRVSLAMEVDELLESIGEQVNRLLNVAAEVGVVLDHIKLHGALYNDVETDAELAEHLTDFIAREFPALKIMGLANAEMEAAALRHGHPFIREGFLDRRYLDKRRLAPRHLENAVIADLDQCLEQALRLARGLPFESYRQAPLQFPVDSICLHGDHPKAPEIALALLQFLRSRGIEVRQ